MTIIVKINGTFVDPDTGRKRRYVKLENALTTAARISRWSQQAIVVSSPAYGAITVDACAYDANGQVIWSQNGGWVGEQK